MILVLIKNCHEITQVNENSTKSIEVLFNMEDLNLDYFLNKFYPNFRRWIWVIIHNKTI